MTILVGVVRVGAGHVPDRGLGLDVDETGKVVDLIEGLRRVLDLPDDHRGDLDRVAVGVVDLGHLGLVVADPGGDLAPLGEGVDPAETGAADRAVVAAEQLDHPRLARLHLGQPPEGDGVTDHEEHRDADHDAGEQPVPGVVAEDGPEDEEADVDQPHHDEEDEQRDASPGRPDTLCHDRPRRGRHLGWGCCTGHLVFSSDVSRRGGLPAAGIDTIIVISDFTGRRDAWSTGCWRSTGCPSGTRTSRRCRS